MKLTILASSIVLSTFSLSLSANAENLSDLSQLLSTKQCPNCDLSGSGLVQSNLKGANLSGADLTQANLSQANLSGANLSGANLTGASLYGANLMGANLTGAIIDGVDLRGAFLSNAILTGLNLDTAIIKGAIGIPQYAGDAKQFNIWGLAEAQKGDYKAAIKHYNQAIVIDPLYAPAYLSRAFALHRLGSTPVAISDAQMAVKLFEEQADASGKQAAEQFIQAIQLEEQYANADPKDPGGDFGSLFRGVASILLQFLVP